MENISTIRIELGINAQKIIQHLHLHNENIETQIAKGIELALDDLCKGDNFIQNIRESTKLELSNIVHRAVLSWDTKTAIEKAISEKISKRIEEYANQIADQLTSNLK